jgi:hypothetical protein
LPKPPAQFRCSREGCTRRRSSDSRNGQLRPCCSLLCEAMRRDLAHTEALVRDAGTPDASELWALAVEANDLITRLQARKRQLLYTQRRQDRSNDQ